MFKIKQIINQNSFLKLKEDWNFLLKNSGNRNIFLTWEWLYNWWNYYNEGQKLFILVIELNNKIVGIAPFYLKYEKIFGIKIQALRFLGDVEVCSEQLDLITHPDYLNEIYTAVLEYLHKFKNEWDYLFLTDYKKNSNSILLNF